MHSDPKPPPANSPPSPPANFHQSQIQNIARPSKPPSLDSPLRPAFQSCFAHRSTPQEAFRETSPAPPPLPLTALLSARLLLLHISRPSPPPTPTIPASRSSRLLTNV